MENITLGQIAAGLGVIVAILGGYKVLYDKINDIIEKIVSDLIKPTIDSIADINSRLDKVDTESCKNFLVRCLADIEKGDRLSETEAARFWEQYDHYIATGGNTYIKSKVDKLREQGRL